MSERPSYETVAEFCGRHRIHRATFYREVARGSLTMVKYGRKTLVPAGQSLPTSLPTNKRAIASNAVRHGATQKPKKQGQNQRFRAVRRQPATSL